MAKKKSLFNEMAVGTSPAMPEMPKSVTIREAENGYIVTGPNYKDRIAKDLKEAMGCLEECFKK